MRIALPVLATVAVAAGCGSAGSSGGPPAGPATGQVPEASAHGTPLTVTGGHLTDAAGRTVYLWVADPAGKSTCTGACAHVWPPVLATGGGSAGSGVATASITTIARSDGTTQLAYAGHPLYYYAADTAAGDTHGQGSDSFGAKWWELSAAGQAITGSGATTTSQTAPAGGGYGY